MISRILVVIFLAFPLSSFGMAKAIDLPKFSEVVKDQIYRGGQPTDIGFIALAQMKMKTVLDLRNESRAQIQQEEEIVKKLGMEFISVPLSGFTVPDEKDMDRIEDALEDPKNYPIYVHCHYGKDRTGLAVGLYRVLFQKVEPKVAYQEMLEHGFHKILFALSYYFEQKTGFDPKLEIESNESAPLEKY